MIYSWAGERRIKKTEAFDAGIPVICVGNLTVGGSGKTPLVAAIRENLRSKGKRAASLSRGYKGSLTGPLKVDFSYHSAAQVGDEPLMLSCTGETWIGADRPAAAKAIRSDGADVIIMDDGHQNPTLKKDLSIVVIDGGNPVGNGQVFPKGPLREPVARGLERADAVIIMGTMDKPLKELEAFTGPVIRAGVTPADRPPTEPLIAFAGIGRPQKFFDTLAAVGGEIVETVPFPDHHTYRESDLALLRKLAEERGARLITTEKDFVRMTPVERDGILNLPVQAVFDETVLDALLQTLFEGKS
jgi:tetraacyldisaccharide 4'-kinase